MDFSDVVPSGYAMIGYARFILGTTYALREALQATPLAISNVNFNSTIIVANITNSDVTLDTVSGHMIIVRNDMLE